MVTLSKQHRESLLAMLDGMRGGDPAEYAGAMKALNRLFEVTKSNAALRYEEIVWSEEMGAHTFRMTSAVEKTKCITAFTGPYAFLDMYTHTPFEFRGCFYKTAAQAFYAQAVPEDWKKDKLAIANRLARSTSVHPPQKYVRGEWRDEHFQLDTMREVLYAKFTSDETLKKQLLEGTKGCRIEYHPVRRHDMFWGVWQGAGLNHLGLLLMETRMRLQQEAEAQK